jgi:thiol-disulfide isomerase/thioredoxin
VRQQADPVHLEPHPGIVGLTVGGLVLLTLGTVLLTPPVRAEARSFRLEGLRTGELQPEELLQGDVIVIVWASWSPRCRDIVERSNAVLDRWGDRARVLTVVFQEDRETVDRFLTGKRPRVSIFLDRDGAFSKRHTVTHLPGLLIFKDGDTGFSGRLPANPDSLIEQTLG